MPAGTEIDVDSARPPPTARLGFAPRPRPVFVAPTTSSSTQFCHPQSPHRDHSSPAKSGIKPTAGPCISQFFPYIFSSKAPTPTFKLRRYTFGLVFWRTEFLPNFPERPNPSLKFCFVSRQETLRPPMFFAPLLRWQYQIPRRTLRTIYPIQSAL